jgi:hypothetical protein
MSLSDLASLGSFVSGVAVLVSVVFLYFQLRQVNAQIKQAERNQQAAIQQERSARVSDVLMRIADPSIADAISKGMAGRQDMTRTEFTQFRVYSQARFTISEDTFLQHKNGLLGKEAFATFSRTFGGAFHSAGMRVQWKWLKGSYDPEFVAFTDRLIAETPRAEMVDEFARWNAEVARELRAGGET